MAVRPSEPLEALIARVYGPPEPRAGDRSGRAWWICPFHHDRNPSLCVTPGEDFYHCFGCGVGGDGVDFLRRLNPSMTFHEAKAAVEGGAFGSPAPRPAQPPRRREPPARPPGWDAFALGVVTAAETELWSERGRGALEYLRRRGLSDATIRGARLGTRPSDSYHPGVFPDKSVWVPAGVVIPWFEGDRLGMVNVRRGDGCEPRYWAVRGSHRGGAYPSRSVVQTGRPVVVVEGEFESLLLGQELAGMVPALTFGSAGDRPTGRALDALLGANPWFIGLDADPAGEKSAAAWSTFSTRCRRVVPPLGKDWTEAAVAGVNLRRWWTEVLAGNDHPPLFSWEELSAARWGHALDDPGPAIDVPADHWRWRVANLPTALWCRWRARSGEIQAALGRPPTAADVVEADRQAAAELGVRGAETDRRRPHPQLG